MSLRYLLSQDGGGVGLLDVVSVGADELGVGDAYTS